jgi:DNA-binding transcriptional LysR family regulator
MPRTLDVDLLRTFHAVAKLGRFKDAAAHVNRSPSSVTAQIQKLEEMVAQRLFTRNNQAVELTQYGHKLLSDTTEFLLSHDRLVESLSPQMLTGKLRLGIPDSYAAHFMAEFLPRFAADRPLLELTVEARSSEELQSLFSRGQLDITIAVVPKAMPHGELLGKTHPVWVAARTFKFNPDAPLPIAGLPVPRYRAERAQESEDPAPDAARERQFAGGRGVYRERPRGRPHRARSRVRQPDEPRRRDRAARSPAAPDHHPDGRQQSRRAASARRTEKHVQDRMKTRPGTGLA